MSIFDEKNDRSMGTPYTFDETLELFYFDDNFRRIAQWVRPFLKAVCIIDQDHSLGLLVLTWYHYSQRFMENNI